MKEILDKLDNVWYSITKIEAQLRELRSDLMVIISEVEDGHKDNTSGHGVLEVREGEGELDVPSVSHRIPERF